MSLETVILEEKEYFILEKLKNNSNEYYVLVNSDNIQDVCVRKKIIENGEEYLIGLDNEKEFNMVMKMYNDKKVNQ